MTKIKAFVLLSVLVLLQACGNDDNTDSESEITFLFEDGFEVSGDQVDDLILPDNSRWSTIQMVNPNGGENSIEINTDIVSEGVNSIRLFSNKSDEILSKIDIEKGGFLAPVGSTVKITADFYLNTDENIANLFLMDLECCSCWDPTVPDNQCPGIRLMMSGGNDFLSIERGKILGTTIRQTDFPFPRKQWVNVQWELVLSQEANGLNRLIIDGTEVISSTGANMPNAQAFRDEFAMFGLDFSLQDPLFYERIQIGATANPTLADIELFVDAFSISIE